MVGDPYTNMWRVVNWESSRKVDINFVTDAIYAINQLLIYTFHDIQCKTAPCSYIRNVETKKAMSAFPMWLHTYLVSHTRWYTQFRFNNIKPISNGLTTLISQNKNIASVLKLPLFGKRYPLNIRCVSMKSASDVVTSIPLLNSAQRVSHLIFKHGRPTCFRTAICCVSCAANIVTYL